MSDSEIAGCHARLLRYAQSLTAPSGWKVEVSGDEIIVMAARR
ncbi:hypothetical protein ACFQ1I_43210 [Kitasatospora arboriphila]